MKPQLIQPIDIALQPSRLLLGLLLVISITTGVIAWRYLPILSLKITALVLIIATSSYSLLRDALLRLPWSWRHLQVSVNGELSLMRRDGKLVRPRLAANSFVHPAMVILNFKGRWWTHPPLIIFNQRAYDAHLRRLRVYLRWGEGRFFGEQTQTDSVDTLENLT